MQSAQLSTVEKHGMCAASSLVIESLAIGRGKATTGAPVGISCTASMIGFTANSGLNCADEPIATTINPDSGSLISWEIADLITSYCAPASVTSTSLPLP